MPLVGLRVDATAVPTLPSGASSAQETCTRSLESWLWMVPVWSSVHAYE